MVGSQRLVGIFGVGRNGSSLLMRLLDGSPRLWIYPVEMNLGSIGAGIESFDGTPSEAFRSWVAGQERELQESYVQHLVEPIEPAPASLAEEAAAGFSTLPAAWPVYFDLVRREYGADRVGNDALLGFKSTEGGSAAVYESAFPGIRSVHIVRDPFSAYASLKRTDMLQKHKPFWFQGDLLRTFLERRWIPHVQFVVDALRRAPDRHFLVTYEQLVADPTATVARICGWLEIPLPERPTEQTVLGGREVRELPSNVSKEGVPTPRHVVADMSSRHSYEEVVTEREQRFIALRTARLGRSIGYEIREPGLRLDLFRRWIPPDRWERMNVSSKRRLGVAFVSRRAYIFTRLMQRPPSAK